MDILFLLIPIALGFLVIALAVFFWAIRNGQYDDMESQGLKVVMEDKQLKRNNDTEKESNSSDD